MTEQIKKEHKIALIIFILLSLVYLFPVFLGKVDTPIDIRNVLMYPWKYYTVDSNVKKLTFWEGNLDVGKSLNINKNEIKELDFNLSSVKNLDRNITEDLNCYLSFDFKTNEPLDISVLLINTKTNQNYIPQSVIIPPTSKDIHWYKAIYPINDLIKQKNSIDLNVLKIKFHNKSKNSLTLYLKDLKLICEDFSSVPKVHNPAINDYIQLFTPLREFYSESIMSFKLPLWNNYILTGAEFLAEPQVGFFHPLYFISYLLFDHFTAHLLIVFLCLVFCGFGAYLLSRYWELGFYASLLAGIVYMFNPFNSTWISQESILLLSVTLPFLILAYERSISSQKFLNKHLITSAILLGLIFISGHLQVIYYSFLFFTLFTFFKSINAFFTDKKLVLLHLSTFTFISIFSLMFSSVVLIPFCSVLENSQRVPYNIESIKANSIPLEALFGVIFPYYKGTTQWSHFTNSYVYWWIFNNYIYFGIIPFVMAIFSLKTVFRNKLTAFFFLTIIFSWLMCTGSQVFFFSREFIPGFKQLQHHRFLEIYSYSVPFLAAIGFQAFEDYITFLKNKSRIILFIFLITVSAVDIMCHSSYFISWSNRNDYKLFQKNGGIDYLLTKNKQLKQPFRVMPIGAVYIGGTRLSLQVPEPNTLFPYRIEEISGYSSFPSKDIYNLFIYLESKNPALLYSKNLISFFPNKNVPFPLSNYKSKIIDLLNVKYFLLPKGIKIDSNEATKVYEGDCAIYENKDYLPRAFLVSDYKVIKDPKEIIVELDSPNFDPRKEVILRSEIRDQRSEGKIFISHLSPLTSHLSPLTSNPQIKYDLNKITINAITNRPGFLILGNNLNNNWKVKVNGKESEHLQANLVQRAVYLPKAGSYLIEFYYYPKLFLIGLFITCFALIVLGLLIVLLNKQVKVK